MIRIVQNLFVVSILAAASTAAAATFTARPLATGESWTEDLSSASTLAITVDDSYRQQQRTVTNAVDVSKRVSIRTLAPNGDAAEIEVAYDTATQNGADLPVAGRAYRVSFDGARVSGVAYAGGGPAPAPAEAEFVERENRSLDRLSMFARIFDGIRTDDWVSVQRNFAARLVNADDDTSVDSLRVRLLRTEGTGADEIAEFEAQLELSTSMKKNRHDRETASALTGSLQRVFRSGTIRVYVSSCRPVEVRFTNGVDTLSASGAANGKSGKHDTQRMTGIGTSSLEMLWSD